MRKNLKIFGYEINIRPINDTKLHISEITTYRFEEQDWVLEYPLDKRINVFIKEKGFIDYVFRNYDIALLRYGDSAFIHLEYVLRSFHKMRKNFENKGATPEQLKLFDKKIFNCFKMTINIVRDRILTISQEEEENINTHLVLLEKLEKYDILRYYKQE